MKTHRAFTKHFEQLISNEGYRYTFYCDICGSGYITSLYENNNESEKQIFLDAQDEAKLNFNFCPDCDRWVCGKDYDAEVGKCIEC